MATKLSRFLGALLIFGALLGTTAPVHATTYYGCYSCHSTYPTGLAEHCQSETLGDGWTCNQVSAIGGSLCWTNNQACAFGIDVLGGGGGGGGNGCNAENGAVCPAACISCRRPAI